MLRSGSVLSGMLSITLKPSLMPLKYLLSKMATRFSASQRTPFGGGRLNALNTKGEITEFTCEFVPNKPGHNFPVYSEGLFYACTDKAASPGFYDIEGNMVIDLSSYNMGRIPYSSEMGSKRPVL